MHPQTDTITKLETRFWQSMVDKDPAAAKTMIAEECLVIGSMGTMKIDPEKYAQMASEGQWTLESFEFSDLAGVFPSDDVALVAYEVHQKGAMKGNALDMRCADSTTWVRQSGEWKCAMHTETMLSEPPKPS